MYLAYLDDSDTRDEAQEWQVISAVLVPADSFFSVELMSAMTIEELMPEDQREDFVEFHASQLHGGYPPFEKIEQQKRMDAIRSLLSVLGPGDIKIAYGALNLKQLKKSHFGSANPQDVAFRRCVEGAAQWIYDQVLSAVRDDETGQYNALLIESNALFIMDESDPKNRATIQKTFRSLRPRFRLSGANHSSLPFVHDDIYFGDSRYSVGIQIADLCSYFIAKHLAGKVETEHFFKMIEPNIISAVTGR